MDVDSQPQDAEKSMEAEATMTEPTENGVQDSEENPIAKIKQLSDEQRRLKIKEITLLDVVHLNAQIVIDDPNNKAGVLEHSKVHDALLDMCEMGLMCIDWSVTKRYQLEDKERNGIFIVGLSPIQVRAGRDWVQGLFLRGKGRKGLEDDIQGYSDTELGKLLKDLHFRDEIRAKIMNCALDTEKTSTSGEIVRMMIWTWLDSVLLSTSNIVGHTLSEEASMKSAGSSKDVESNEEKPSSSGSSDPNPDAMNRQMRHLCSINRSLHDCVVLADEKFNEAGLELTDANAETLLKTHVGAAVRCYVFLKKEPKESDRHLEDFSRIFNQLFPSDSLRARKKKKTK